MADRNSTRRHPNFKDLTGKQFGKWKVLAEAANHPSRNHVYWTCLCECGTENLIQGSALTGSDSHSCRACSKRHHGMLGTPEYLAWNAMKQRCNNPKSKDFLDYGQNGIAICARWLESFKNFYADMGPRPSASHSIDRKDGSKGYDPSNCRWATPAEQARNRRTNRLIEHDGRTQCMAAWAEEVGISQQSLYLRLKRGWTIERALTEPVKAKS